MSITLNDRRHSRGLRHINLFVASYKGEQIIAEFKGKTIPGVVTVIREDYTENGKWSHSTWTVEPAEGVVMFSITQDWETGNWLNTNLWNEAIGEFQEKAIAADSHRLMEYRSSDLEPVAIERFIRSNWKNVAKHLDENEHYSRTEGSVALIELLKAQNELADAQREESVVANEIKSLEETEILRNEAQATRNRVEAARAAMKNGVNFADLKAILRGNDND